MNPAGPGATPLITRVLAAFVAALFVAGVAAAFTVDTEEADLPIGEPDSNGAASGDFDYRPGTTTTTRPGGFTTTTPGIPESGIDGTASTIPPNGRPGQGPGATTTTTAGSGAAPGTTTTTAAPGGGGGGGGGTVPANQAGPASSTSEPGIYTIQPNGQGLYRVVPGGTGFPTWSPDGSKIAFAVPTSNPRYMIAASDGSSRLILGHGNIGSPPSFSADSSRIAFSLGNGSSYDVWVVGANGTGLRKITSRGDVSGVAWSPGGRIAFLSGGDVWTVNPDGTGLAVMASSNKAYRAITFSPDGSRLAWYANDQVWVANENGANPRPVASTEGRILEWLDISWSPDGTRLAFRSGTGGASRVRVVGHDASGNHVAAEDAQSPDWSPGGSRLAIFTAGPPRENGDRDAHLELADPDRATFRQRVLDDKPGIIQSSGPRYSRDGGRLVIATGGLDRGGPPAPS